MALSAMAFTACDDDNDNKNISLGTTDDMFVENVALGNMTEVELGALAAPKRY